MHTIIGIGKSNVRMKAVLFLGGFFFFSSCGNDVSTESSEVVARSPVEVISIKNGELDDELELSATTIYLNHNLATAPIPAFITKVFVHLGDAVKQGEILYELESKERRALGSRVFADTSLVDFGIVLVRATASGIISTLDKQQAGDYVLEGTQLCTISQSEDLAFQVNVPFEYTSFVKYGTPCKFVLPDNTIYSGTILASLTTMNAIAQTQSILAKSSSRLFLPENLIVKVLVNKSGRKGSQLLPRASILSDEMMEEFWVMKLTNDSTAVKVNVTLGSRNATEVEILSPQFGLDDRIVVVGGYGLADTASITIRSHRK